MKIKFRAWDKIKNQMSEVRVIDWLNQMVDLPHPDIERDWSLENNENEVVLMQYTGLKDKNGTEIYDEDIVSLGDGELASVYFEEGTYWVQSDFRDDYLKTGMRCVKLLGTHMKILTFSQAKECPYD